MSKVLCVGSATVDFIFYLEQFPISAEKHVASRSDIVGGGIAANAAVAISRLGGHAILSGQLGDDPIASLVLDDLVSEGVDVGGVTRMAGGRSSCSSVYMNSAGERQIINFRGENLSTNTTWYKDIDGLRAVLVDTRLPDAARTALEFAGNSGIPGIVDGEAPVGEDLLERASHVAFSMQGLTAFARSCDTLTRPDNGCPDQTVLELANRFDLWICVTDGARDVTIAHNGSVDKIPTRKVEAVDTLAAGDVWHGAFALALAEDSCETDAVKFANAAGALKCTRAGGRKGAPSRAETLEFMNGHLT